MVWYLCVVVLTIAVVICIRTFLFPNKDEKPIPFYLKESDLYKDGNRLLYMYEGQLYEAITIKNDYIYIYDKINDKIVKVPYVKGE